MRRNCDFQRRCNFRWQNEHNRENVLRILIDFLGEFLFFLSSIIECKQFYTKYQLQKLALTAEKIHQIRLKLSIEIENRLLNNSFRMNRTSISFILRELTIFIRCFQNEQRMMQTKSTHSHALMLEQLLHRLERIIQSCTNCNLQSSLSNRFPCMNPTYLMSNVPITNGCYYPCTEPAVCIPWSGLEQMKRVNSKDEMLGLVFGIKNKKLRRQLGYGIQKQTSEDTNVSNVSQLSESDMTSITANSSRHSPEHAKQKKSNEENSTQSQKQRTQPFMNSKNPSMLSPNNLYTSQSISLTSIPNDLPTASTMDPSESQPISSNRIQKQKRSNMFIDDDSSSRQLASFQTDDHRIPSKTVIKISDEKSLNSTPIHHQSLSSKTNLGTQDFRNDRNQSLLSFQSADNTIDSSISLSSRHAKKINEIRSNETWKHHSNTPQSQDTNSLNSRRHESRDKKEESLSSSDYSQYENNDNISPLDFIETSDNGNSMTQTMRVNDKKHVSNEHFPVFITHQKQTIAPNNGSNQLSSPSPITHISLQSNQHGFFLKFLNSFRKPIIHRTGLQS